MNALIGSYTSRHATGTHERLVVYDSLIKALSTLSERENFYLFHYFWNGFTMKEIGEWDNITPTRVRQVIERAKSKLRHPTRSYFLKGLIQIITALR